MKVQVQIGGQTVELGFKAEFVSVTYPKMTTRGICCVVTRPDAPPTVSDDELRDSLRLRVPGLGELLTVCGRGTRTNESLTLFFDSEEFSRAPAPPHLEVLWYSDREMLLGQIVVDNRIAQVHWDGHLVGILSGIVVSQPYYYGVWSPVGNPEFEQAFCEMQVQIAPDGLGVIPVTFRSSDGTVCAPAAAIVPPAPRKEPYFRFGSEGITAHVVHKPTRDPVARTCERCGRTISPNRLHSVRSAPRCSDCQTEAEKAGNKELSLPPTPKKRRWWRWW